MRHEWCVHARKCWRCIKDTLEVYEGNVGGVYMSHITYERVVSRMNESGE